jgi:hypothetical protein
MAGVDEYYTQLPDIEAELRYYKDYFKNKTVFCNCDDPFESNFFKYFAMNFNHLELKKLIATCYVNSPIAGDQISFDDVLGLSDKNGGVMRPHKIEVTEVTDENQDGAIDLADVEYLIKNKKNTLSLLEGNGDFRSDECIELLKESDIVVTNPPFSLFREYVEQLITYDKKFIILGNKNAITYEEIFPLIANEKLWIGYRNINADMWFIVPDGYECERVVDGLRLKHIMACWFTNIDTTKRHKPLTLYKSYSPEEYPKYDNYDAINVNEVAKIPYDYDGVMGVPITYIDKHNPDQFEILGITDRQNTSGLRTKVYTSEDSSRWNDLNRRSVIKRDDGSYQAIYARILIQRKGGSLHEN